MDFNTIRFLPDGWEEPEFLREKRAGLGPSDLADVALHFRRYLPEFNVPISDPGLKKLLELVFFASLEKNEGRSPRFCLRVADPASFRFLAQLSPPCPLEPRLLRKLWPASGYPFGCLAISERTKDGGFTCEGFGKEEDVFAAVPGRPEIVPVGGSLSALIQVDDPGSITCGLGAISYHLRAGRIRQIVPWSRIPGCETFLDDAASYVIRACEVEVGKAAHEVFGGVYGLKSQLTVLWGEVLARTIAARHGGTFVVLPSGSSLRDSFIVNEFGSSPAVLPQAIAGM